MAFPRRPSAVLRYVLLALLLTATFCVLRPSSGLSWRAGPLSILTPWRRGHPIDHLIRAAESEFARKISRRTTTLADAAAAYRRRRGRHPPPGFDKWYEFAVDKGAIIVEDFWDQIYHDLEPFWALDPAQLRRHAAGFEMRIVVRDGRALTHSDWFWTRIWLEMLGTIEHLLPDMDIALNPMDEPRIVVRWEDMQKYMRQAAKTRTMADPGRVVSEFERLPPPAEGAERLADEPVTDWEEEKRYWLIARRGCPPGSAARTADVVMDFDKTPFIESSFALKHMRGGYVANYTLSTDFCHQADLQALEGIFVEPLSTSATDYLFPLFGGSKLAVNNEILLPAPMYWREDNRFMGTEGAAIPWADKYSAVVWRGVATGGRNRETNWRAFQRHRFVAMNNATQLALVESGAEAPLNFALPAARYSLSAQRHRRPPPLHRDHDHQDDDGTTALATWVRSFADVAFTELMCVHDGFSPGCDYTTPHFVAAPAISLAEQFRCKLLPDVDGNSFSGRYLGFLRSTSLPVKATLWREWHDSRLVAWKHFVPMDSRFGDWYGIVEYFLGDPARGVEGRDAAAERIAVAGREWAARVLRKEDMQVYVLRLLLEYARVADARRERMGWVGDLPR